MSPGTPLAVVEVPDRMPDNFHAGLMNRRLTAYLAARAEGKPGLTKLEPSVVTVRPLTEEEREARARRLAAASREKRQPSYRCRRPEEKKKLTQTEGAPSNATPTGPSGGEPEKGVEAIVLSSPSGPDESDSQAVASKPAEVAPSGGPALLPVTEPPQPPEPAPRRHVPRRKDNPPPATPRGARATASVPDLGALIRNWLERQGYLPRLRKPRRSR